jgi:hypothetical protein
VAPLVVNLAAALAGAAATPPPEAARIDPAPAPHCPQCGGQRFLRMALPKEEMPPPAGRGDTS